MTDDERDRSAGEASEDDPTTTSEAGEGAAASEAGEAEATAASESLADAFGRESSLDRLRGSRRERLLVAVAGVVVGLLVAFVHWVGFVLGGALVALPQVSIRRGLAAGVAFGVFAWLVFLLSLATAGVVGVYTEMGPIVAVSTVTPVAGGLLGSLARGVV